MQVTILGSGLLGVTAAYVLASRGHDVEVIDRKEECGRETSFANGGQLSYSHAEPWATPGLLPKLPRWLIDPASPLIFRPRLDGEMIRWGLEFLRNCTPARAQENCVNILRLGLYSKAKLAEIRANTNIQFDFTTNGILEIFSTQKDLDAAAKLAAFEAKFGCEQKLLTREECLRLEPTLAHTSRPIVGGMHAFMDECGDAYTYCKELAAFTARQFGTRFTYSETVQAIEHDGLRITGILTDKRRIDPEMVIMALGSYSPLFLKPLGINVSIYPMKGYSLTLPASDATPGISVTDGSRKVVYTRLGDRLRVAGTAEFGGYDNSIPASRIRPMIKAGRELFPGAAWDGPIEEWACLRPSTPDGPPILGRTKFRNLLLNTGHGTLGWTQAAASAYIVADIMEERTPEIMLTGLTMR